MPASMNIHMDRVTAVRNRADVFTEDSQKEALEKSLFDSRLNYYGNSCAMPVL